MVNHDDDRLTLKFSLQKNTIFLSFPPFELSALYFPLLISRSPFQVSESLNTGLLRGAALGSPNHEESRSLPSSPLEFPSKIMGDASLVSSPVFSDGGDLWTARPHTEDWEFMGDKGLSTEEIFSQNCAKWSAKKDQKSLNQLWFERQQAFAKRGADVLRAWRQSGEWAAQEMQLTDRQDFGQRWKKELVGGWFSYGVQWKQECVDGWASASKVPCGQQWKRGRVADWASEDQATVFVGLRLKRERMLREFWDDAVTLAQKWKWSANRNPTSLPSQEEHPEKEEECEWGERFAQLGELIEEQNRRQREKQEELQTLFDLIEETMMVASIASELRGEIRIPVVDINSSFRLPAVEQMPAFEAAVFKEGKFSAPVVDESVWDLLKSVTAGVKEGKFSAPTTVPAFEIVEKFSLPAVDQKVPAFEVPAFEAAVFGERKFTSAPVVDESVWEFLESATAVVEEGKFMLEMPEAAVFGEGTFMLEMPAFTTAVFEVQEGKFSGKLNAPLVDESVWELLDSVKARAPMESETRFLQTMEPLSLPIMSIPVLSVFCASPDLGWSAPFFPEAQMEVPVPVIEEWVWARAEREFPAVKLFSSWEALLKVLDRLGDVESKEELGKPQESKQSAISEETSAGEVGSEFSQLSKDSSELGMWEDSWADSSCEDSMFFEGEHRASKDSSCGEESEYHEGSCGEESDRGEQVIDPNQTGPTMVSDLGSYSRFEAAAVKDFEGRRDSWGGAELQFIRGEFGLDAEGYEPSEPPSEGNQSDARIYAASKSPSEGNALEEGLSEGIQDVEGVSQGGGLGCDLVETAANEFLNGAVNTGIWDATTLAFEELLFLGSEDGNTRNIEGSDDEQEALKRFYNKMDDPEALKRFYNKMDGHRLRSPAPGEKKWATTPTTAPKKAKRVRKSGTATEETVKIAALLPRSRLRSEHCESPDRVPPQPGTCESPDRVPPQAGTLQAERIASIEHKIALARKEREIAQLRKERSRLRRSEESAERLIESSMEQSASKLSVLFMGEKGEDVDKPSDSRGADPVAKKKVPKIPLKQAKEVTQVLVDSEKKLPSAEGGEQPKRKAVRRGTVKVRAKRSSMTEGGSDSVGRGTGTGTPGDDTSNTIAAGVTVKKARAKARSSVPTAIPEVDAVALKAVTAELKATEFQEQEIPGGDSGAKPKKKLVRLVKKKPRVDASNSNNDGFSSAIPSIPSVTKESADLAQQAISASLGTTPADSVSPSARKRDSTPASEVSPARKRDSASEAIPAAESPENFGRPVAKPVGNRTALSPKAARRTSDGSPVSRPKKKVRAKTASGKVRGSMPDMSVEISELDIEMKRNSSGRVTIDPLPPSVRTVPKGSSASESASVSAVSPSASKGTEESTARASAAENAPPGPTARDSAAENAPPGPSAIIAEDFNANNIDCEVDASKGTNERKRKSADFYKHISTLSQSFALDDAKEFAAAREQVNSQPESSDAPPSSNAPPTALDFHDVSHLRHAPVFGGASGEGLPPGFGVRDHAHQKNPGEESKLHPDDHGEGERPDRVTFRGHRDSPGEVYQLKEPSNKKEPGSEALTHPEDHEEGEKPSRAVFRMHKDSPGSVYQLKAPANRPIQTEPDEETTEPEVPVFRAKRGDPESVTEGVRVRKEGNVTADHFHHSDHIAGADHEAEGASLPEGFTLTRHSHQKAPGEESRDHPDEGKPDRAIFRAHRDSPGAVYQLKDPNNRPPAPSAPGTEDEAGGPSEPEVPVFRAKKGDPDSIREEVRVRTEASITADHFHHSDHIAGADHEDEGVNLPEGFTLTRHSHQKIPGEESRDHPEDVEGKPDRAIFRAVRGNPEKVYQLRDSPGARPVDEIEVGHERFSFRQRRGEGPMKSHDDRESRAVPIGVLMGARGERIVETESEDGDPAAVQSEASEGMMLPEEADPASIHEGSAVSNRSRIRKTEVDEVEGVAARGEGTIVDDGPTGDRIEGTIVDDSPTGERIEGTIVDDIDPGINASFRMEGTIVDEAPGLRAEGTIVDEAPGLRAEGTIVDDGPGLRAEGTIVDDTPGRAEGTIVEGSPGRAEGTIVEESAAVGGSDDLFAGLLGDDFQNDDLLAGVLDSPSPAPVQEAPVAQEPVRRKSSVKTPAAGGDSTLMGDLIGPDSEDDLVVPAEIPR